ncbi:ribonuclease HI [Alkalibacterium putridalgicola]|uniref:Ribonuclease HI n=1 Tax=Alkalibacterium putridalgicola TaxID=426703 RepID=A0A1H7V6Z0_9LACT|nr:ribonuclease HI family protein [Alkalibacterium putridalgicola]GEK89754.1 ribonuclease HI [Alkalibacterium putridalgicola]SEM04829.1 ribonuclease HI [Alkalibacterium putridalgicola]
MLRIYSDAAVSPKEHLAGAGLVIVGEGVYEQLSIPLSSTEDNHLAELMAFHHAVNWPIEQDRLKEWTIFHTDSQLVAQAIRKNHMKSSTYKEIFDEIIASLEKLSFYEVKWIPEKENKGADNLAKQALAKQRKNRK